MKSVRSKEQTGLANTLETIMRAKMDSHIHHRLL